MERKLVTVAVDGSAEFTTLTAAAAAQDPAQPLHFVLGAGTYYERPFLELVDYIITGAGMGQTVISAPVPFAARRFSLAAAAPGWST